MRKTFYAFAALAVVLALAVSGCGSSNNNSTSGANANGATETTKSSQEGNTAATSATSKTATILALTADPSGQLEYTTSKLTAKAGTVVINFSNPSSVPHDVAVADSSGKKLGATPQITKGKAKLTLKNLKPGTYTYFCTVPGHEAAGMKGTLTVK